MEDVNWKMFVVPIVILFVFIGGIIGIVNWQKSKNEDTPTVSGLTVNLPEGEMQSEQNEIIVSGQVKKGDQVFINGAEVEVDKEGAYSRTVILDEGTNKILIQRKRDGEEIEATERVVTYTPATAPTVGQPAPVNPAPAALSTSGPEEVIIPIVGLGGVIVAIAYYARSKKQLALNLRK